MKIIEQLNDFAHHKKIALVIRHADREQIPSGEYGNEILLNDKGIENSVTFGRLLKVKKVAKIFCSPIQRCVQTGQFIANGYEKDFEIIETRALGAPGFHITDEVIAGQYYLENGFFKILDEFRNGITTPGMRESGEFYAMMSDFIKENSAEEGITIFITHDAVISLLHYCYDNKIYTEENWVEYLNGFIIPIE